MTNRAWLGAMLVAVAGGVGCLDPQAGLGGGGGGGQLPPPPSGSDTESTFCGDGVCEAPFGEDTATCPIDCQPPVVVTPPPAPVCDTISLGVQLPVDLTDTTVGAAPAVDAASCGDGETVPTQSYTWIAPAAGVYTLAVAASFPIVFELQHGACDGTEAACTAAELTNTVSVTRAMGTHEELQLSLAGEGGATGTYELTIDRQPDACGDKVCEASETNATCAADCPAPVGGGDDGGPSSGPTCGNGVCEVGETSSSCSFDCGSPTSGDPTSGDPTSGDPCADGSCGDPTSGDPTSGDPCADGSCGDPTSGDPTGGDPCDDGSCDSGDDGDDGDDGGDDGDDAIRQVWTAATAALRAHSAPSAAR